MKQCVVLGKRKDSLIKLDRAHFFSRKIVDWKFYHRILQRH